MNEMMATPTNEEEVQHDGSGSEGLGGAGRDHLDPESVRSWLGQFGTGDIFQGLAAFGDGGDDDDGEVGVLLGEEDLGLTSSPNQESALAALSNIPHLGRIRKRKKDTALRTFTEDDFENQIEKLSFRTIKNAADILFDKKAKVDDIMEALLFLFGRTDQDDVFNFDNCCKALSTRNDVLRLRIHFEFWRTWKVFPMEFPFLIDPVPSYIEGEIYYKAGDEGYDLAKAAWRKPGIQSAELIEEASGGENTDDYLKALQLLSDSYIMSQQNDCWYLTGRNPIMRAIDHSASPYKAQFNNVSWSKMF